MEETQPAKADLNVTWMLSVSQNKGPCGILLDCWTRQGGVDELHRVKSTSDGRSDYDADTAVGQARRSQNSMVLAERISSGVKEKGGRKGVEDDELCKASSNRSDHQKGINIQRRGKGSEERAIPVESTSAENRSTQEQERQQRQQPANQLERLAWQERVGARLDDILKAGEGYVCPIVLWRAPEEIRLLLERATEVPTFGVTRLSQEQQVLEKVTEWLGPSGASANRTDGYVGSFSSKAIFPVGRLEMGRPPKAIPAWVFKSPEYRPVIAKFWEDWTEECSQDQLLKQIMIAVQRLRDILQRLLRGNYLAHKKTGEEHAQKMEELNKGPEESQTEEEWWAERVEAARGWRELQAEDSTKWGRRTKEAWITLGERMSRQFFVTVATRKAAPLMTAMDHPFEGQTEQQHTTRGILKCVTDFYRQLLTEEEQWTPEEMASKPEQDIWSHVQRLLNLADTCKLEEDITTEEVARAIAELPRLKTPGLDGMSAEHYKELRNFLVILLTSAYNEALKGGALPQGFVDAYVVLLFKKGAKEDMRNWRQISILNALYKILAKILANRLKEALPSIIDHTHTGFVAGRQIVSNILLAQQILEEEQCTGQAMAFVSIDLEKAYD
ncbi:hypothetical protein CBR_g17101 [Chara braunii]|uniref:Reverse transcriptase domain-containing protein n=1 Tax=Chara braunii TaxID=69332 RepID=A0A388KUN3_CHABU|nr:hypothetical protein CBR_g17101 [Chara braunii]|eukprot:GBG73761.1 hypothetical protein CBR_g17101 [Chara braunii]